MDNEGIVVSSQQQKYVFLSLKVSRLSLEPTLPPMHWVIGEIMPDSPAARGVKLATFV
jgi:hypothetical protein